MYFVVSSVSLQPLISLEPPLGFWWNLAHRVFRVSEAYPTTFKYIWIILLPFAYVFCSIVCLQPLISRELALGFWWNLAHRVFRVSEPDTTTFNNNRVILLPFAYVFCSNTYENYIGRGSRSSWKLFKLWIQGSCTMKIWLTMFQINPSEGLAGISHLLFSIARDVWGTDSKRKQWEKKMSERLYEHSWMLIFVKMSKTMDFPLVTYRLRVNKTELKFFSNWKLH